MKTSTLLIALGVVSSAAFAQMHMPPQPEPQREGGSQPGAATMPPPTMEFRQPSPDTSHAPPNESSGLRSSGDSSVSDTQAFDSAMPESGRGGAGAPPVSVLEPKTENDVTYLCGGIGADEARYMKREARAYDMMLTFAARNGEYLADVNVDIQDASGNQVLQTTCGGPIMLIDLPKSGNYRVRADASGYTLNRTMHVQTDRQRGQPLAAAALVWPQRIAQGTPTTPSSIQSGSGSGVRNDEDARSGEK